VAVPARSCVVGLSGVAGVLPPRQLTLAQLAAEGRISSSPDTLSSFGFDRAYVCGPDDSACSLALAAARAALVDAALEPGQIDLLIWASARPENHLRGDDAAGAIGGGFMDGFKYASGWLQDTLDLSNAEVMAVAQQGCSTMFAALRVAHALLSTDARRRHILCVGADVLPTGSSREILYNVISDAACAVVVSRDCPRDRWIADRHISRGYYWDPTARQAEIVAAYFPSAKAVIEQLLDEQGLAPGDVNVVVPTGVNRASWQILMRLVGIPEDRFFDGLPSFGHTMTSDNLLYLQALRATNRVARGARLLLFTYGFGSSWCAILLEH
jgi:3-oxoacyl-[acyl-carrier-protein] synthase-3